MTTNKFRPRSLAAAVAASLFAVAAGPAFGAAFALQESSVSGLGNAFAGGAAAAEDATTVWSNPAGMSRLSTMQIVGGLNFVTPSFKFQDQGSVPALSQPLGGTGGDAGSTNYVPNVYFVVPFDKQWAFGVGVSAPFGLVTEYDSDWLGRFQGVKSDIKTINVNPALSWKPIDNLAVGVGVNWQRIDATFTSKFNYSAGIAQTAAGLAQAGQLPPSLVPSIIAATPGLESNTNVEGNDDAWGWNLGVLWDVSPSTRIGVHYRSAMKYSVTGNATFDVPALSVPAQLAPAVQGVALVLNNNLATGIPGNSLVLTNPSSFQAPFRADIKLPDMVNLSLFSRLDDKWDVMGDVQWTNWSTIPDLTFVRTNTGTILQSTPENFKDSWRYSVGANYHYTDAWLFRGGLAWDGTPVNNTDRTVRLPDANRFWLSLGAQYKLDKNWKFDGGFTYIWVDSPSINQNAGSTPANGLVNGKYDDYVTIFGLQATYSF